MSAPLGICRGCDGRTPLRRISGKVRWHDLIHPRVILSSGLILPGGVERCPGSGEPPKGGASL